EAFDTVIANGHVMDPESGLDAVRNVGIRNGKIAAVTERPLTGKSTIDAKGLVVAPGFIDPHEHGQDPRNYGFQARDGVTTSLELEAGTDDFAKWYAEREGKSLINFGVSIGHIPFRATVMSGASGEDLASGKQSANVEKLFHHPATPEQLAKMVEMIDRGMKE